MKLHIAKDGDSLPTLAARYGVATERILAANPQLEDSAALTRGMKVKIPTGPVYMTSAAEAAQTITETQDEQNAQPIAPAVASPVAPFSAENASANVPAAGANGVPPLSGLEPTTPGIAPESFAAEAYTAKREEESAPQPVAASAVAPAAELPTPTVPEQATEPSMEPQPAPMALPTLPTVPTVSNAPNASSAPNASTAPSAAENEPLPSYYKTEPAAGELSPLHVQWSGMNDGPAVHPFAPLPTPVVPAGAPTFFPGPVGFGAMPVASPFGAYGGADPSAFATYGAVPEPFSQQSYPQQPFSVFPQHAVQQPFPGYSAPAAHDCGCGGQPAPRLPYALPLREAALRPEERVYASAAPVQPSAEPQAAAAGSAGSKPKRKRSASASVSGTDRLQSFLKRASGVRRPSRRKSKPWVND